MTALPYSLYLKSRLVASPLEGLAKKVQKLLSGRWRNLEMAEILLEDDRMETVLQRLLKPTSNCVDVGCHIGSFLSTVSAISPQGAHTAIEASPRKSRWLQTKFTDCDIQNVAVGHERGTATFFEDTKRPGFSRLGAATSAFTESYEVEVRCLDELLADKDRIDLLKIDIEGNEFNALVGAQVIIAKHKPVIIFECGSEDTLQQVSASRKDLYHLITETLGYQIFTLPDFLYGKGSLSFDEFRKCGIYPFRAFNFVATR